MFHLGVYILYNLLGKEVIMQLQNEKLTVIYPDYSNSIVNLSSTILKAYGAEHKHDPLKQLDVNLLNNKKNIVLIIFDGMGYDQVKSYIDQRSSDLFQNLLEPITSVCPSSTPAAITSIMTESTPLEHGVLGWTLFFKEFGRYIELLPMLDHIDSNFLSNREYDTLDIIKIKNLFTKIKKAKPDVNLYKVTPEELVDSYFTNEITKPAKTISHNNKVKDIFAKVQKLVLSKKNRQKFILAYSTEPDITCHINGVESSSIHRFIHKVEKQIKNLKESLKGTDTALIIVSDHGLTNVNRNLFVNEDQEFYDCMIMPTFPEKRFFSVFLKKHKIKEFEKIALKYKDDFIIMSREEFLEKKILGVGEMHHKTDDFLGDYIFIAKSDAQKQTIFHQKGKVMTHAKAAHAGITSKEMLVPLIFFEIK